MRNSFTTAKNIESLAIGTFDGVHSAHKILLKKLNEKGGVLIIEKSGIFLTPSKFRCEYIDFPCFYYRLEQIKRYNAKEFVKKLRNDFANLKQIVVGYDFIFGKDKKYNSDDLKREFDGRVKIVDEIKIDGISVHASKIKEILQEGNIELANKLLGHTYKITGKKIKGRGVGKKYLFPTINVNWDNFFLPKDGVYATITGVYGFYEPSVTFIGKRESFDNRFSLETYIIDKEIEVENDSEIEIIFFKRVRDNKKFSSIEDLKRAMRLDAKYALNLIKSHTI